MMGCSPVHGGCAPLKLTEGSSHLANKEVFPESRSHWTTQPDNGGGLTDSGLPDRHLRAMGVPCTCAP